VRLSRLLGLRPYLVLVCLLITTAAFCATPVLRYKVIATFPHSTSSYTEGFFYLDGLFYEGTGLEGHSAVMAIDPPTGRIVRQHTLSPQYFGEGIVDWGPYLYEWTWKTQIGFVYDRATFQLVRTFRYAGEGWGMTRSAKEIITSDGTSTLRFRDPSTFAVTRSLTVTDAGHPVNQLNELEYIKGEIYSNVWHSNRIVRISPSDGHVIDWIDLSGLLSPMLLGGPEAVLNGIAYDAQHDRLFVTGKQWPLIFEIQIVPKRR
jgi:glutamine cyclotransferase